MLSDLGPAVGIVSWKTSAREQCGWRRTPDHASPRLSTATKIDEAMKSGTSAKVSLPLFTRLKLTFLSRRMGSSQQSIQLRDLSQ